MEREREQQRIAMEAERLERERKRLEDMAKEKDEYIRKKAAFLNLVLTDGLIIVKVLQSVTSFTRKGKPCTIASIPTLITMMKTL